MPQQGEIRAHGRSAQQARPKETQHAWNLETPGMRRRKLRAPCLETQWRGLIRPVHRHGRVGSLQLAREISRESGSEAQGFLNCLHPAFSIAYSVFCIHYSDF